MHYLAIILTFSRILVFEVKLVLVWSMQNMKNGNEGMGLEAHISMHEIEMDDGLVDAGEDNNDMANPYL